MYCMKRPVTYSEVGADYKADMAQVINYFQDCSCFQSDFLGVGPEYMERSGKVWILNSWQIIVERYPKYGEQITVGTWAYDFRGPLGMRNFIIDDASGCRMAKANSVWAMVDIATGRPVRVDAAQIEAYQMEPKEPMDYAGRKIAISGDFETLEPVRVTKACLDTNHHMNNGRYVAVAMEYLPDNYSVRQIRVEYKRSAKYGDILIPKRQKASGRIVVLLEDIEGEVCVITEFTE
ncbi:acyl-[acyl-carrier-protein] thioesterase [Frisingicoccus sp.]|uniref:acyl-[acyl-carrier-protein] thioesterase n=1 Tax=Frisingicoccus sp. TaxID=1918627 RepID=UPI003AB8A06B